MRIALALAAALALAGCSTLEGLNPFAGKSQGKLPELEPIEPSALVKPIWQGSAGAADDYVFAPAVVGSSVFVAGADGAIARYDEGREVWRIKAGQALSGGVGADGKVVLVGTPKGEVLAFDADGKPLWQARVSSEVLSAPALHEGIAVVRSGDNRVYALELAGGKRRWSYQRSTPSLSLRAASGVTLAQNAALAGFPGGKLVAINYANGAALWEGTVALPKGATELERVADVAGVPVAAGRTTCAVSYQGRVACFDLATGQGVWAKELSSTAGLDMDERYVVVTDDRGAVLAFDRATGASIWKQGKLAGRGTGRPLILGTHVAVADARGLVHLLRREDGAFAARLATDGSPIVADLGGGEGTIVAQTSKGGVFAFAVQ